MLRNRGSAAGKLTSVVAVALAALTLPTAAQPASPERTADLRVTATAAPASVRVGIAFNYTFTIRNLGPAPARATALALNVPAGVLVESVVASAGTCSARSCSLGTMRLRAVRTVRITGKSAAVGLFSVSARVSSPTRDSRLLNNRATATVKVAGDDSVRGSGTRPIFNGTAPVYVEVDAISGPNGEEPSGTFATRYPTYELRGRVVCLTVAGQRASVGGIVEQSSEPSFAVGSGVLFAFTDAGEPGAGVDSQISYLNASDPGACPIPLQEISTEIRLTDGNFVVHDEQP